MHVCTVCKKTFSRSNNLAQHVSSVHNGEHVNCPQSAETYSKKSGLDRHISRKHQQQPKTPSLKISRPDYMKLSTSEKHKYVDVAFTAIEKQLCSDPRPIHRNYSCGICNKEFQSYHSLQNHLSSPDLHYGRWQCGRCTFVAATEGRATKHHEKAHPKRSSN